MYELRAESFEHLSLPSPDVGHRPWLAHFNYGGHCECDVEMIGGPDCQLVDSSVIGKAINDEGIVAAQPNVYLRPDRTAAKVRRAS